METCDDNTAMLAMAIQLKRREGLSVKPSLVMISMVAFWTGAVNGLASVCHAGGPAHAVASCLPEAPAPCFSHSRPSWGLLIATGRPSPLPSGLAPLGLCLPGAYTACTSPTQPVFPFDIETAGAGLWPSPGIIRRSRPGCPVGLRGPRHGFYSSPFAAPGLSRFSPPSAPRGRVSSTVLIIE